jgi:predicted aspartyl protease
MKANILYGHVYIDVVIKGEKGEEKLENVVVYTGATFTFVEEEILKKIGAIKLPSRIEFELGDGKKVVASCYAVIVKFENKEVPSIILIFPGAKRVIGTETLESLGARINPITHKFEFVRERG